MIFPSRTPLVVHGSHCHSTAPAKDVSPCAEDTWGSHSCLGTPVRSKVGRDGGQGYRMGTQAPALLLCMAELRCKSKKGSVRVHTLAWHKNKGAQLAAPCLPLLSIPEHICCWPGQVKVDSWSYPCARTETPGLSALLGLLVPCSTGTAIWHLGWVDTGGDSSVWGTSGQGARVAVGILGALLQAGMNTITQEGKQPQLVYGMGTQPFSTGEVGES